MKSTGWRDALLIYLAAIAFFCVGLGARSYLAPSEARYIEIPRQMLLTGDWLTPRIDGVPYFEKPPLFYWMQAVTLQILGMGEFAGRIATAKLAALLCAMTYATGRMLYGRRAGWLSAIVLATSLLGYGMSRVAQLDMPVSLFITGCIAAFLAAQSPSPALPPAGGGSFLIPPPVSGRGLGRGSYFYLLMYVSAALAVMSKGLIGMVIPAIVIGGWIGAMRRWHILKEAKLITGSLVFLLIAAPWHIAMARVHPDFLNFYFIHEHFDRYVSDDHHRNAPWWFFIAITAAGLLPWTGLLPATLKRVEKKDPVTLFLLLWIALPFVFFSASHSKLVPYIFPIFPPLCILLGRTLSEIWEGTLASKTLRTPIVLIITFFGLALLASQVLPSLPGKLGSKLSGMEPVPLLMLLPMAAAFAALAIAYISGRSARMLIVLLALCGAVTGLSVNTLASRFDTGTIKPLVLSLKDRLKPDDTVVAYESYWQDLPVYLQRDVTVAGYLGELTFGAEHYPETQRWIITAERLGTLCTQPQPLYVFMREGAQLPPECHLHVSGTYGKTVLLEK